MFLKGRVDRLPPGQVKRIRTLLSALHRATGPADLIGFPGLHPLRGDRLGYWALRVSRNWRVVFRFEDGGVRDVDLVDYH